MKKNNYHSKPSELQPVIVKHDPRPNHSLKMYPFNSEESIQWHLLRHGFVDCWINPQAPKILSESDLNGTHDDIWKNFIAKVKCPRWSINLPAEKSKNQARKQWEAALNKGTVYGCNQCQKNSEAQFKTCYDFYETYRLIFLKKIKAWIVETIQDNDCLRFYETGKKTGMNPKRKHAHLFYRTKDYLWAYIIQINTSGSYDFFKMIFQLSTIDKKSNTYIFHYNLKTIYGIETKATKKEVDAIILENINKPIYKIDLKCHEINW